MLPKRPAIRDREARRRHPGYRWMPLPAVREVMRLQHELLGELDRVTAPLCLVYSRRDPTVHPGNVERILKAVSSSEQEVRYLSRSGHVITVDLERQEVTRRVLQFLRKLEAREIACAPPGAKGSHGGSSWSSSQAFAYETRG
jgi:esterase/lipase